MTKSSRYKLVDGELVLDNNEYMATYMKSRRRTQRDKILDHYGRICKCCGETTPEFLTIDHKNNDGYKQKKNSAGKTSTSGSQKVYTWIINNNYPDSIEILCWNCNCGRAQTVDKVCPHKILQSGDTVIT